MKEANDLWRVLVVHEWRLTWRQWRLDKWASGAGGPIALGLLLVVLLHLAVWILVALLPTHGPVSAEASAWIGAITLMFFAFMLATALSRSVEALFERNDLDLLFSAPVSARPVLVVRTLTVAGATFLLHALYLVPIANMAILTGRTWLWPLYVVVPLTALLAAACAMLLSLVLMKVLGARRTRTLVQVIAVIAGALGFLFTQFGPRAARSVDVNTLPATAVVINAFHLVALPVLGDLRALLALTIAVITLSTLAWTRLDRVFLRGSQETLVQNAPRRTRRARVRTRPQVTRNLTVDVCIKEWRSITRDPLLLTRIGMTFVYIAPLLAVVWRRNASSSSFDTTVAAATCVFIANLFSQQLSLLTVNMEDAPQLLLTSPRSVSELLTAKVVAAALPATALACALLCLVAWAVGPVLLIAAPVAAAAAWSSASIVASRVRLIRRVEFGKRGGQPEWITGLLVLCIGLLLASAGALLMTRHWWAALPLLVIPGWTAWNDRRKLAGIRADSLIHD